MISKNKSLLYVYIGTVFYTLASYYHLSLKDWTLKKALIIAVPLVLIEYIFSLRGNHSLNEDFKINPVSIMLITMCFYFINTWLLNYFVLKNEINPIREIISLILILIAFYISTNAGKQRIKIIKSLKKTDNI